jgi:hypothetical protein
VRSSRLSVAHPLCSEGYFILPILPLEITSMEGSIHRLHDNAYTAYIVLPLSKPKRETWGPCQVYVSVSLVERKQDKSRFSRLMCNRVHQQMERCIILMVYNFIT